MSSAIPQARDRASLALDSPDAVHTLALMEPARPVPVTEAQAAFVRDVVAPAVERYRSGDKAGAVDIWAQGVFGSDYRGPLEQGLPGIFDQAVADADAFFAQELPALREWSFTEEDATRIPQPVLAVRGEHTLPTFPSGCSCWSPGCRTSSRSSCPMRRTYCTCKTPRGIARALASFYARHPLTASRDVEGVSPTPRA